MNTALLAFLITTLGLLSLVMTAAAGFAAAWFKRKQLREEKEAAREQLRVVSLDAAKAEYRPSMRPPQDTGEWIALNESVITSAEASLGPKRMAEISKALGPEAAKATLTIGVKAAVHDAVKTSTAGAPSTGDTKPPNSF